MLKLPPYATVAVPIWLLLLIIFIIVLPLNAWWEPFAPTQYAAFVLREASFVPIAREGDNGCQFGEVRAWLLLQRHPQGRIWLKRILEANPTPAGRTLSLVGLTQLGEHGVKPGGRVTDSIHVLSDTGWLWWAPAEATEQLRTGSLAKRLATAGPCRQWGLH